MQMLGRRFSNAPPSPILKPLCATWRKPTLNDILSNNCTDSCHSNPDDNF